MFEHFQLYRLSSVCWVEFESKSCFNFVFDEICPAKLLRRVCCNSPEFTWIKAFNFDILNF